MNEKIKRYLEWKATYAQRASVNYKIWLERFIEVCGDKPIEEYSISDYVRYKNHIEHRFSSYSVQYATVIIKNFFKFYRDQNIQCMSPTFIRLPKANQASHRPIKEAEYLRIISNIPSNDFKSLRDLLIIRMLWDTGVRVSELCELNVSQIEEGNASTTIRTKKSGNKRIIVWSDDTHQLIMKYLGLRNELENVHNANALFITNIKGIGWEGRITRRTVQRILRGWVTVAGINEKISPHSFRHGWAHKRRDQNAPLAFIQRGLGHLSPVSTFIYEQYNDHEFVRHASNYLCNA